MTEEKTYTVIQLIKWLILRPSLWRYKILICATDCIPPSPWSDKFWIDINHEWKTLNITAELT